MTTKTVRPIRFARLFAGSNFAIFAEPSRTPPVRKSNDTTVYRKECEAYSVALDEKGTPVVPEKAIILYPEDLVVPLSRGT